MVVTAVAKEIYIVSSWSSVTDIGREGEMRVFSGKKPKVNLSKLLTGTELDELRLGRIKT